MQVWPQLVYFPQAMRLCVRSRVSRIRASLQTELPQCSLVCERWLAVLTCRRWPGRSCYRRSRGSCLPAPGWRVSDVEQQPPWSVCPLYCCRCKRCGRTSAAAAPASPEHPRLRQGKAPDAQTEKHACSFTKSRPCCLRDTERDHFALM